MDAAPAGYSGTPLPRKLGIKPGHRVAFVGEPEGVRAALGELPDEVTVADADGPLDLVVFFTSSAEELRARFGVLAARLAPAGMLWIAWPKKASRVATDLDENVVRGIGLAAGLVDTKVCAIDAVWSGLRFVVRLADRPRR
ncbi:MAG TPA: hypothetical protein VFQ45_09690 [Longimicrobium sp.]|nr:hypothetical protein [Longimicrobium sp.]